MALPQIFQQPRYLNYYTAFWHTRDILLNKYFLQNDYKSNTQEKNIFFPVGHNVSCPALQIFT